MFAILCKSNREATPPTKPIHFNYQNSETLLQKIGQHLFIELANDIFCNAVDFPPFNDGDKVRSKNAIGVGKPKPLLLDFTIKKLND